MKKRRESHLGAAMKQRLAFVRRRLNPSCWMLVSFLFPIGLTYVIVQNRNVFGSNATAKRINSICQTIIADPNPPTNVRSSPIVASDNTTDRLSNGTVLAIVDENEGWLRINSPVKGWVYKELTVTSCINSEEVPIADPSKPAGVSSPDQGGRFFQMAQEQYQMGNLNAAIALAKMVTPNSPIYQTANQSVPQWQRDWQRAESEYYNAQKALRDGQWEEAINKVNGYPDIRYWKEKLALVVQQATQHKQKRQAERGK